MDYSWIGPLIQMVGGAVGEAASAGDKAAQLEVLRRAQKMFGDISVPELQNIVAQTVPESQLSSYTPDAQLEGNQRDVLARLDAIERGGGFAVEDKADLARIGQQVAAQQRTAQAGLSNALARRGATGSGEDYASRVALAQSGTQAAHQAGLDQGKLALQRRLAALGQRGSMATSLREQDFSEKARIAEAADAIQRYNANARNAAALANNQNARDAFGMQYQKALGASGQAGNLSNAYGQNASDTRQFWGSMGRAGAESTRDTSQASGRRFTLEELEEMVKRARQAQEPKNPV